MKIRKARPSEANSITDLAMRSKAHWGYDEEFMAAVGPLLTITETDIADRAIYVAEEEQQIHGFYAFGIVNGEMFLTDLFIDPDSIRRGLGKLLWDHAVKQAANMGLRSFKIESDPNALDFYQKMGAIQTGTIESASGRTLPLLRMSC